MSAASTSDRASLDEPTPSSSRPNGKSTTTTTTTTASHSNEDGDEVGWRELDEMSTDEVRAELARVRDERDAFETQYRSLLSKLTTMRATLGDRLRQDAEELDRRETQIETLSSQVSSLESTVSTLRTELVASHDETERLSKQVDALRASLSAQEEARSTRSSSDAGRLERERELHELVERTKLEAHSWQSACLEERAQREELETLLNDARHTADMARQSETHYRQLAEREARSAAELSSVLSEFEATQEAELSRALGDHRSQVAALSSSLAEYKTRAEEAEAKLDGNTDAMVEAEKLTAQVREKNLLIGKLRHEAVILNEHLTEALRRLRNDQSDNNVDKRLVTNLVLQFLTTPRTDAKRFEMLNLIAGVLDWHDPERQAAGLQKGPAQTRPSVSRTGSGPTSPAPTVGGDESFSNLFVEFLLSEAERGKANDDPQAPSAHQHELPSKLPSPTRTQLSPPPHDESHTASRLGSYFGLSRGGNRK